MKCFNELRRRIQERRTRQPHQPRLHTYFGRQLILTAGQLLLSFVLLGALFVGVLFNYLVRINGESLRTTAEAVANLASAYSTMGKLENIQNLRISLTFASEVSGTDAVICDDSGTVILCSCKQFPCPHLGLTGSPELLDSIPDEGTGATGTLNGLYDEQRYILLRPLYSRSTGEKLGTIIVSVPTLDTHQLLRRMMSIFIYTALLILLMAILLSSMLAQRQSRPVKAIASAARRFARGELSVRVSPSNTTAEMAELETAFNNMASSLEQSENLRRDFVANVSHELKTPMTTIAGFMDGMLDGTIPPELHPKYMKSVSDEVRRLSRLVRSMLEISRLQSAQIQKQKFDICELMSRVLITFEQKISARELQVQFQAPDKAVYVMGDPDNITQVVYNLLENAVKFSSIGAPLTLTVKPAGGKAVISVQNVGPTIPPEELRLIFDRFHKGDHSRGMDKEGMGLGLYLVKTILAAHGEDITVTSADGLTTFTFTLSLARG